MLRSGHLLSSTAMARDLDRCETAWPCSYQRIPIGKSVDPGLRVGGFGHERFVDISFNETGCL